MVYPCGSISPSTFQSLVVFPLTNACVERMNLGISLAPLIPIVASFLEAYYIQGPCVEAWDTPIGSYFHCLRLKKQNLRFCITHSG